MVTTAMGSLANIGFGLIKNILFALAMGALCFGFYYGYKFVNKNLRKQKAFLTEAIIIDLNGVIELDMLALVKNDENGMLEMEFKTRKADTLSPVPKHLVKNNKVILLNYAPGHYCVLDTSETVNYLGNGIYKLIPYNLGMKKYIMDKQREFLNKADAKKKNWETKGPWIVLGVAFAMAVFLAWLLFYLGVKFDATNIATRLAECTNASAGAR